MRQRPWRRVSKTMVFMCSVVLLIGMLLGAITATNTGSLSGEHRPELNAIVPHAVVGAVVGVSALIVSLRSRSCRWVTWPVSIRTTSRAAWTIRSARTSFGGVIRTVIGTALMVFNFFLVFRMGFQATVGFNPALTLNAWGGPTAVGSFIAHGLDAVVCIGVSCLALNSVLLRDRP